MVNELSFFGDQHTLADAAARHIVRILVRAMEERGAANMVLSGGQTPRAVYQMLKPIGAESGLDWSRVDLFWGDERSVPPDHPDSNFRMAQEELIQHINIPDANIHRIMSECPPDEAAARYSAEIRKHFGLGPGNVPAFDMIMLGTGTDGHIASIFPGSSAETEQNDLVTATYVEKLRTHRITMTFPVLNNAAELCILVAGRAKAGIVKDAFLGAGARLPVHQLRPGRGKIHWFADSEAASMVYERNTE